MRPVTSAFMPDRPDVPAHRYDGRVAEEIETRWQDRWDASGTFTRPNPTGPLADGFEAMEGRPKLFVLDMFPYPSGDGPARRPSRSASSAPTSTPASSG